MKLSRHLIIFLVLAASEVSAAEIDKDAGMNADEFLAALKIYELAEGKQAANAAAWPVNLREIARVHTGGTVCAHAFPEDDLTRRCS